MRQTYIHIGKSSAQHKPHQVLQFHTFLLNLHQLETVQGRMERDTSNIILISIFRPMQAYTCTLSYCGLPVIHGGRLAQARVRQALPLSAFSHQLQYTSRSFDTSLTRAHFDWLSVHACVCVCVCFYALVCFSFDVTTRNGEDERLLRRFPSCECFFGIKKWALSRQCVFTAPN